MNILEQIVLKKNERLKEAQARVPYKQLRQMLEKESPETRPWPLTTDSFNVIAEVKRASPSLGKIPWQFSLPDLVKSYEDGGAGAISVLTEQDYFQGSIEDLQRVRRETTLPILRKDFLWTEYQLVESRLAGADAVLLIVSLLNADVLKRLLALAKELGLQTLVECRDRLEIEKALKAGAQTIGINNRDLRTFDVKLERTIELAELIPVDCVLVSESGIHTGQDAARVASAGAHAVLVGESCLRQNEPAAHVKELLDGGREAKKAKWGG